VPELRELAESLGIDGFKKLTKQELVYTILDHQALSVKDKTGGNGSKLSHLPDEVPVSSDNMRVDKRQPADAQKQQRGRRRSKTDAPEAEVAPAEVVPAEDIAEAG